MKERLQKIMAHAGIGSRRACEELIEAGRVSIDGETVRNVGMSVDSSSSVIKVDGETLQKESAVYFALNKPKGVVSTSSDEQGRVTAVDLLSRVGRRVYAVGRLDRNSEGLLLLTNDGNFAEKVAHPRYQIPKVYAVRVRGHLTSVHKEKLERGIQLAEGRCSMEVLRMTPAKSNTALTVSLREGVNREIRRLFAKIGHPVTDLKRIAIGPVNLGDLKTGSYRPLKNDEVRVLLEATRAPQGPRKTGSSPSRFRSKGRSKTP